MHKNKTENRKITSEKTKIKSNILAKPDKTELQ